MRLLLTMVLLVTSAVSTQETNRMEQKLHLRRKRGGRALFELLTITERFFHLKFLKRCFDIREDCEAAILSDVRRTLGFDHFVTLF